MANESNPLMAYSDPDQIGIRVGAFLEQTYQTTITGLITALGDQPDLVTLAREASNGMADHELPALKIALVTAHDDPDVSPERQRVLRHLLLVCHARTMADGALRRTNERYDAAEQRITGIFLRSLGRGHQP